MPSEPVRIYWDSCVLLALFSADPERVDMLRDILDEVSRSDGQRKIVTSEIAKVEVAFVTAEKASRALSAEEEAKLDRFWADDSVIQLIEFSAGIAVDSRTVIRNSVRAGTKIIKPLDAIHLASAKYARVQEFHTYDLDDYKSYDGSFGFKVCVPFTAQGGLRF